MTVYKVWVHIEEYTCNEKTGEETYSDFPLPELLGEFDSQEAAENFVTATLINSQAE